MKRIALTVCAIILVGLLGKNVEAKAPQDEIRVTVTETATGEEKQFSIPINNEVSPKRVLKAGKGNVEKTETGSFYVEIIDDKVNILNEEEYADTMASMAKASSTITDSSSTTGTYWKATVSITYSYDNEYCTFSKVGASWSQQHGTSTLSNRVVYWGGTLGITFNSGTYYPTSNSVSYNTGWGATRYGGGSIIGCNSSATYTTYAGQSFTISADI